MRDYLPAGDQRNGYSVTFDGLDIVNPGRANLIRPFMPSQLSDSHVFRSDTSLPVGRYFVPDPILKRKQTNFLVEAVKMSLKSFIRHSRIITSEDDWPNLFAMEMQMNTGPI